MLLECRGQNKKKCWLLKARWAYLKNKLSFCFKVHQYLQSPVFAVALPEAFKKYITLPQGCCIHLPSVDEKERRYRKQTPAHFASLPYVYLCLSSLSPLSISNLVYQSKHTSVPVTQAKDTVSLSHSLLCFYLFLFFPPLRYLSLALCVRLVLPWSVQQTPVSWIWAPVPQQSRTTSQGAGIANALAYKVSEIQRKRQKN